MDIIHNLIGSYSCDQETVFLKSAQIKVNGQFDTAVVMSLERTLLYLLHCFNLGKEAAVSNTE